MRTYLTEHILQSLQLQLISVYYYIKNTLKVTASSLFTNLKVSLKVVGDRYSRINLSKVLQKDQFKNLQIAIQTITFISRSSK